MKDVSEHQGLDPQQAEAERLANREQTRIALGAELPNEWDSLKAWAKTLGLDTERKVLAVVNRYIQPPEKPLQHMADWVGRDREIHEMAAILKSHYEDTQKGEAAKRQLGLEV